MALSDFDTVPEDDTAVTPIVPEQTPYERDFLPAQRKYFKELAADPKMGALQKASLLESSTQMAQQSFMRRAAVEQAGMDIKSRQMQFETAKFSLDQSREEAARKRNMFGELSKLQEELNPVTKDTTLDSVAKKEIYGQLAVKYAGIAAVNPAVAYALNAANASLSTQPKDRVTKLDYFNAGADPKFLASYEQEVGRSLGANEDVPIDVYGAGLYSSKQVKEQEELKSKAGYAAMQRQQAGLDKTIDLALKGKLAKDPMKAGGLSNEFEEPASKEALKFLVTQFGTPEEQKGFQSGSAIEQIGIGQRLAFDIQSGKRLAEPAKPARPSLRSSFTTPSK